jgi:hypothetical protein
MAVDESSSTAPRAKYYRDRAEQARLNAASANGATRNSLLMLAYQWEVLASGIEGFKKP